MTTIRINLLGLRLGAVGCFALAATLATWSAVIAWSDWISKDRTRESILRAIRLLPQNSLYYRFWAEIQPSEGIVALRQAAALNPLNPAIRCELGLAADRQGKLDEAESSLLQAIALDRTFASRWVLADFYFRHRQVEKFWPAARDALQHPTPEIPYLFEDFWVLTSDSALILNRAIPDRTDVLDRYLAFLLNHNHIDATEAVADRIMQNTDATAELATMLDYCNRMIEANHAPEAVRVWNWLCKRKLLIYPPLDPTAGLSLTNGNFAIPPASSGFDWRLFPAEGLYVESRKLGGPIQLTFTGNQPERHEMMIQFIPLQSKKNYRLRVRYRTSDLAQHPGLFWRIVMPGGLDLLAGRASLSTAPTGEQLLDVPFVAPDDAGLGRLALVYERQKGTVRIEGSAEILGVGLSFDKP